MDSTITSVSGFLIITLLKTWAWKSNRFPASHDLRTGLGQL